MHERESYNVIRSREDAFVICFKVLNVFPQVSE